MLFGESLVRADDSNAMVGELVMHLGDVNSFHMAGDAILRICGARFAEMIFTGTIFVTTIFVTTIFVRTICDLLAATLDVTTQTNCVIR